MNKEEQEAYRLKQVAFKQKNKQILCIVNIASFVATIACFFATIAVLAIETEECPYSSLRFTLYLVLGMHVINTVEQVCEITQLDHIFCGCICTIGFFLYEVGVVLYMGIVWASSGACKDITPAQVTILFINMLVYAGFIILACFFQLRSIFGSADEEEKKEED